MKFVSCYISEDTDLIDALNILDENLSEALNNGDAAKSEIITIDQLQIAVAIENADLVIDIRIMRLEIFNKTNQKMKARTEYDLIKQSVSEDRLDEIKMLTGFEVDLQPMKKLQKPLLNQIDSYFIVDNLYLENNGVLNSVLRKMTLFQEEWGYDPVLVVVEYNRSLKHSIGHHQYYNATRINTGIKIQNMYDYFQKTETPDISVIEHPRSREGYEYREIYANTFDVYKEDILVRKEFFVHAHDRLSQIDYLDKYKKITHKEFYDKNGYLSMVRYHDEFNKEHYHKELYYTVEGKLCIEVDYTYKKNKILGGTKSERTKVTLYDNNANIIGEGQKESDLLGIFLNQVAKKSNNTCLFVFESGIHDKGAVGIKQPNAIKTALVHAGFLEDSYNLKSKPQIFYKELVRHQEHYDGIIFLTKAEGNDFIKIYGKPNRIYSVPHFYPKPISKVDFETRNPKKAVIVARLDPLKRLDVAIDIFKLVVDKVPDVHLDIYGFGAPAEEARIKKHIIKTKMGDYVTLKGSTDKPEEMFSSAILSMMTSKTEGFGITLIESVSNGCPVFAFDIKYGPSDVIKSGSTGFLFPRDNNKVYAKQLIEYFNNIDLQRKMSENCYEDATRFSKEVFMENWYGFMEEIYHRHMSFVKPIG